MPVIESDLFVQWIVVPDDRPTLPPVDEDIGATLRDFSSLGVPDDFHMLQGNNESGGGLLLGADPYPNIGQAIDTSDAIVPIYRTSPDAGQNMFLPIAESSPSNLSYASLFLPALSPDSSPTSVGSSTPWLRTPETDPSLYNLANFTSMNPRLDITEEKEGSCSTIHFLDQSGNSLEDIPSQVQELMPEDIACTPQIVPDAFLPQVLTAAPSGRLRPATPLSLPNTPTFMISPPCASTSPIEAVLRGPAHCTSFSPSLSPLSTLSSFSRSPGASPNPSPLTTCSVLLPPALSPVSLRNGDETVGFTDPVSSTFIRVTPAKLRRKRSAGNLDDEAPPSKLRSKAKNVDEEEWNAESERVKRPRAVASLQSTRQIVTSIAEYLPDEGESSQGSGGHSDATHTSCEICGQGFTRTSDYIRHIENSASHPETRKMWPCPYCDSALGRKDALVRHVRTIHPDQPDIIPRGIPGGQLREGRKEPSVQRIAGIGQRKTLSMRQPKKNTRRRR